MTGDEGDSRDETWCLFDGELIDDELYFALSRFALGCQDPRAVGQLPQRDGDASTRECGRRRHPALPDDASRGGRCDLQEASALLRRTAAEDRQGGRSAHQRRSRHRAVAARCASRGSSGSRGSSVPRRSSSRDARTTRRRWTAIGTAPSPKRCCGSGLTALSPGTIADSTRPIRGRLPASQSPNLFTLGRAGTFAKQRPFTV